ncbi:noncanonical pyrimidine nucleotidase, YjjG family protein [Spirochaetia bacterium]|nr:noncanonical pyrimidine nucleotidase, YjjG family protein [Spirochaetia bacterium]
MKLKAAIFDLDDTLYDYQPLNKIAMDAVCDKVCQKIKITREYFFEIFNASCRGIKSRLGEVAASHNRVLYFQTILDSLNVYSPALCLELYDLYWGTFLEQIELRCGVLECFKLLREQGIKIAICTDLTAHIQHRKILKLCLNSYIDVLVTSEEAGIEKPNKAIFALCLDKLGVNAAEAFFVGDSLERDIEGAKNAGIFPVHVTSEYAIRPDMVCITNFVQMYDWLDDNIT